MTNPEQDEQRQPGFPEQYRDVLREFVLDASRDLSRIIDEGDILAVLSRLTQSVATDVRLTLVEGEAGATFGSDFSDENPLHIRLPRNADRASYGFASEALDAAVETCFSLPKDERLTLLKTVTERSRKEFGRALRESFREDVEDFTHALEGLHPDLPKDSSLDPEGEMNIDVKHYAEATIQITEADGGGFSLEFITPPDFFRRWSYKNGKTSDVMQKGIEMLGKHESARRYMRIFFRNFPLIPQSVLAESIVRQGHRTIMGIPENTIRDSYQDRIAFLERKHTQKLTLNQGDPDIAERSLELFRTLGQDEPEKMRKAKKAMMKIAAMGEGPPLRTAFTDAELMASMDENEREAWCEAKEYVEKNPPVERRPLIEAVEAAKLQRERAELLQARRWTALASKEQEIAARALSAVRMFSYEHGVSDEERVHSYQGYEIGTPAYLKSHRTYNCFTAPWMTATLLMQCGIPRNQIFFCSVNHQQGNEEIAGSHGTLLVRLQDGTTVFLDPSADTHIVPFALKGIRQAFQLKQLKTMINMPRVETVPVHVQLKQAISEATKLPLDMIVAPLDQGLTATMLLHVGISFRGEKRMKEARAAFELGLASFPNHPDLLAELCAMEMTEGDLKNAELFSGELLKNAPTHMLGRFQAAKIAAAKGEYDKAEALCVALEADKRKPWGDRSFMQDVPELLWNIRELKEQMKTISDIQGNLTE